MRGKNMPTKRNREFTDYQLMTLIEAHPGSSLRGLLKAAQNEMVGNWSVGKIQGALHRLERDGKIEIKKEKTEIDILRILDKRGC